MNQTLNSFLDEEASSIGYLNNFSNLRVKFPTNLNELFPPTNLKEKEQDNNDIFSEKLFSKEFNNVFDKSEKLKSIDEMKYNKVIFNSIPSSKKKFFPFNEGEGIKTCL